MRSVTQLINAIIDYWFTFWLVGVGASAVIAYLTTDGDRDNVLLITGLASLGFGLRYARNDLRTAREKRHDESEPSRSGIWDAMPVGRRYWLSLTLLVAVLVIDAGIVLGAARGNAADWLFVAASPFMVVFAWRQHRTARRERTR